MPQAALEPIARLDPVEAWQPWLPDAKQPWNLKWAAHLYRRAAFGATPTELKTAVQKGLAATLQRLFDGDRPDLGNFAQLRADSGFPVNKEFELRAWWLNWLMHSTQPLREKLTLFWHNHFATSIVKVESVSLMHRQNVLLYKHALGKFGPFLLEISRDPAMLIWLDSNNNVKGKPNENYAS